MIYYWAPLILRIILIGTHLLLIPAFGSMSLSCADFCSVWMTVI